MVVPGDAFNSFPPGQNGRHFADDISRCIFVNEKFCILIKVSLKFVAKIPIDNNTALVQIMAWRRAGDKPLSEPIPAQFTDAYLRHMGRFKSITNSPVSKMAMDEKATVSWSLLKLKHLILRIVSLKSVLSNDVYGKHLYTLGAVKETTNIPRYWWPS